MGTNTGRARTRLLLAGALVATGVVVGAVPAGAAVIDVTTTADGGPGSLRDAFAQASVAVEPTEIVLAPGATYVLDDCAEGDLDHTGSQPLAITGGGATIRQTCAGERVVESGGDLRVVDTTITGGRLVGGLGGGIEADTADVALVRSRVTDNEAGIGAGVGAIRVDLLDSTVDTNRAGSVGGGVWADQVVVATNSTVAANTAGTSAGGIAVVNTAAELTYATIAGNAAPVGANLQMQSGSDTVTAFATVFAEPLGGGTDCDLDAAVVVQSVGYDVASDATCGLGGGPGDVDGGFPVELAALAEDGGPTPTRRPAGFLLDLVECDASPLAVTTDQRGVARPQGQACDVGAVEVEGATPPPPPPTPPSPPTTPAAVPLSGPATFTG